MASSTANGPVISGSAPEAADSLATAVTAAALFPRNGPDASTRSWGHQTTGSTFSAQQELPKQPLPTLESSCERYLTALEPLQSEEEHLKSEAAVKQFLDGDGPILQALLKKYDESHVNWFEHYCYQSFLGDDSPVVLGSNAFCAFKEDPDPSRRDQITRATALVRSAVAFSQAIRQDRLPLDKFRDVPQCMNQYWWLFGVARVPEDDGGRLRMDPDARHIVVFCRGQAYSVNVLEEGSDEAISESTLSQSLQAIVDDTGPMRHEDVAQSSIGILTTENQKVWNRCRKLLAHHGLRNGRNLSIVDSSLFALCLDDNAPQNDPDICMNMLCGTNVHEGDVQVGTCMNRWYDKLAIIVCKNGAAGMNFEHTCTDGSVDIKMAVDIYEGSLTNKSQSSTTNDHQVNGTTSPQPQFQKLPWDIPTSINPSLLTATQHLESRITAHQLQTLHFPSYGTTFIKRAGFSPDAFFQMVLQAAYYTTYTSIRSGFEPVVTRHFLHGRTDVVRTTTSAAAHFARTFASDVASPSEKIETLRAATAAHGALSKRCAAGGSHHRHLYVLQQVWKRRCAFFEANALAAAEAGIAIPDALRELGTTDSSKTTIFTDPGWSQLGTTVLMGSNVDNPSLGYAGFGPASAEGFTVVYTIRADHVAASVTCRNGEAGRFVGAIERTLKELRGMLEGV